MEQPVSTNSSRSTPSAPVERSPTPADIPAEARWRSGPRAPSVPSPSEVTDFLAEIDHAVDDGGIIARIVLESPDHDLRNRARAELLAEDSIVETSIGCLAGPVDLQAFDVLLVAGCDLATVGQAFAKPDEVVGVTTARVDRVLAADQPDPGEPDDGVPGDHSQATIDERFAELTETVETVSPETLAAELDQHGFADEEEVDMATLLSDEPDRETSDQATPAADTIPVERPHKEATETMGADATVEQDDASQAPTQQSDCSPSAGGAAADASSGTPDCAESTGDEPSGGEREAKNAGLERQLSALVDRVEELEAGEPDTDDDIATRLQELEARVESLAAWRADIEDAVRGEYVDEDPTDGPPC